MIDSRTQIKDTLLEICNNVKMSRPAGDIALPLICYAQTGNTPINIAYDRIKWRIAVYCNTFAELVELCDEVDEIMHGRFGFTRVRKTGDDEARVDTDLYLCRLDYSGLINTKTLGVIQDSR